MLTPKAVSRVLLAALVALSAPSARADVVVLKSGEKIEGSIVVETATELLLDVRVSDSITDRKTVAKSDVASVERKGKDEIAFEPLKNFSTGSNSLSVAAYDAVITNQFRAFLSEYPNSKFKPQVEAKIALLEQERDRVAVGEMKLGGTWITAAEVAKNPTEIEARQLVQGMKDAVRNRDMVGALNTFDRLENKYEGAAALPEAVEIARQVMAALKVEVARSQAAFQRQQEAFQRGLELTPDYRKQELLNAAETEKQRFQDAILNGRKLGLKWPPLIARSEESLKELATLVDQEAQRIAIIDTVEMANSARLIDEAKQNIASQKFDGVSAIVDDAIRRWPANDQAIKLKDELPTLMKEYEQKQADNEKARIERDAAAAMASAQEKKPVSEEVQKLRDQMAAEAAKASEEEARPFYKTIPGAIAIVVAVGVVIGVVSLVGKGRKKEE